MHAPSQPAAQASAGATVVPKVKGQVHLEGKMDVDRAREKRQHAEREAHDEAEEIKIRPGHTAPRTHSLCASWNRDADHSVLQTSSEPPVADDRCRAGWRLAAQLD